MVDSQHAIASLSLDPDARQERLLVIPTSAVREVTAGAVLLHIGDEATLRYADLDPAAYTSPAADWQPPYPYTHAQVLLEPDRTRAVRGDSLAVSAKSEGVVEQDLDVEPKEAKH
jgi:hypothetical protein